jgi:hypothetical protein
MSQIAPEMREAHSSIAIKGLLPAVICALLPALCALAIHPVAETGINDDWSYIKTVQLLAQSGHIVYNGWATAMLGWQLYLGALFVKLFGFSFTSVRSSTLLMAMATAYLMQRTLVRAGIRERNAALATSTLVLSPLFLPLAFSFMSDVSGIFCTVLCLYMCLRALRAETEAAKVAWISFAALLNAIGGTARQTAWLGVLVMVPCTLWLLRRWPRVLLMGGISTAAGIAFVFAAMSWFSHRPYAIVESLIPNNIGLKSLENLVASFLRGGAELLFLLLPVLLMFAGPLRKGNHRMAAVFFGGSLAFLLAGVILFRRHEQEHWLAPFLGNYVTARGLIDVHSIMGVRPVVLHQGMRIFLTVATIVGLLSLLAVLVGKLPRTTAVTDPSAVISWRELAAILAPFSLAYIALLAPRAASGGFYDRYLLPLMAVALLVLARFHQEHVRIDLPLVTILPVCIFAAFGIAATHDLFAMYRGYLDAINEIRSSGVSITAINGSWENDGWTQLEAAGYINDPRLRVPRGAYVFQAPTVFPAGCDGNQLDRAPAVKPLYALSFDPAACNGPAGFAPVEYRTWLAPHATSIYVVRYPASAGR